MEPEVKRRQLMQALHFLEQQEYIVARDRDEWVSSSLLEHVAHFGPTFAWCVQAHLQQDHSALTRRCVRFKECQTLQLRDLDVLAFTEDGLIMTVACEANQDVPHDSIVHFVRWASIDTAGGIDPALETTLRLRRSFKHLQGLTS